LEPLAAGTSPGTLKAIRSVAVLEYSRAPEARSLLESLGGGAPEARLTREAKAALERMSKLRNSTP
jgi:hypothetical protein